MKNFGQWLTVKSGRQYIKQIDKDPIPCLIKLYSCDNDAVNELASCRLNPDLNSSVRKDLEFFIPQLLSFYLQGYYDNSQQLVNLILQASQTNFFFSHRIIFFLKAVLLMNLKDKQMEEN